MYKTLVYDKNYLARRQRNLRNKQGCLAHNGCRAAALSRILRKTKQNIRIKIFNRRYEHSLKYEWNHFKFKYSWRTLSAVENRKAGRLCPIQTLRGELSTAWVSGGTDTWSVKKISDLNFSRINKSSTGSVHHCRCGGDIYAHAWIFSRL